MKNIFFENNDWMDRITLIIKTPDDIEESYLTFLLLNAFGANVFNNELRDKMEERYVSKLDLNISKIANRYITEITLQSLNKEMTFGENPLLENVKDYLLLLRNMPEIVFNTESDKYLELKLDETKRAGFTESEKKKIKHITRNHLAQYAETFLSKSHLTIISATDKETFNELENGAFRELKNLFKEDSILTKIKYEEIPLSITDIKRMYNPKSVVKVLRSVNLELDDIRYTKFLIIESLIRKSLFDLIREKENISYNPNVRWDILQNAFFINVDSLSENKHIVRKKINEAFNNLKNLKEEDYEIVKKDILNIYKKEKNGFSKVIGKAIGEKYELRARKSLVESFTLQDILDEIETLEFINIM